MFRKRKNQITKGSFCKIKLCTRARDGSPLAIKRFNKLTLLKQKQYLRNPDGIGMQVFTQLDAVRKELAILSHLDHPNIIRVLEIIEDVPAKDSDGNDVSDDDASDKIYVVMELA